MAFFDNGFGATLSDLAQKIFGSKKQEFHGLKPGDPGYLQATFSGLAFDERKSTPRRRPRGWSQSRRYGQLQRSQKMSRKGHRMKKRQRREGPYAV